MIRLPASRLGEAAARGLLLVLTGVMIVAASPTDAPLPTSDLMEAEPISPLPPPPSLDPRVVALGKLLFEDKRLSVDNRTSCLSCHDLASNGANARKIDPAVDADSPPRNTPTVFNAALDFRYNWAGDALTLEEQARESMHLVMGQDVTTAARKLSADPGTTARFRAAYGHEPDPDAIVDALASFQKTLLTPQSPFDKWLEGDSGALSADAREGYERFKSIGCISCHQGVNIGGNLFEQSGIYRVLTDPSRPLLRVPSLRNVATTAPYFHNGSTATLPEAVHLMARAQLGRAVSDETVRLIVAFLDSLTGQYDGHLVKPPDSVH